MIKTPSFSGFFRMFTIAQQLPKENAGCGMGND